MGDSNGFPLDLPNINDPVSLQHWQERVVERLDFTILRGATTGDAVATSIASISLEVSTVYIVESWVLGVLNSTTGSLIPGQTQMNVFRGAFKLNASAVAEAVGSGASKIYSGLNLGETSEPWTANLTVNENTIIQTVQGTSDDLVHWRCAIKLFQVSV